MMKTKVFAFLLILSLGVNAYGGNDAPHNSSNNITCQSCHAENLTSSPFWESNPTDETYNNFCLLNCHDAPFGPYSDTSAPAVLPHNSTTTSNQYGTWSISCIECHNPHLQEQKNWKNTDPSDYYIASGVTDTPIPTWDSDNNTSVITYSSISYQAGWDANSTIVKSQPYRRPIIMPNTKKTGYTFSVKAIDDPTPGTILVEGDASEAFMFTNPPTNFTIIYGQLVRSEIEVDGTPTSLKIFARAGENSFAYDESSSGTDPTPNGICQICHTATTHWNSDGSGAATGVHASFNGSSCVDCHPHSEGFDVVIPDHSAAGYGYITGSANCTSCHSGADPIVDLHSANCSLCHLGDLTLQGGLSAGDCATCHGAYDSNFETGHQNEDHGLLTATSNATPTLNCGGCHSGDIITDSEIHNSQCDDCHTDSISNGTLTSGTLGDASGHTIGQASECIDCHAANYFASHTHSHTVSLGGSDLSQDAGTACSACHNDNGGSLASWTDIYVEHLSDCTTCHNATRDTSASGTYSIGATIQTVISANTNPTNCLACHRDKIDSIAGANAAHGTNHKGDGKVTGSAQCNGCHDQAGLDADSSYIMTIHGGGCGTCHLAAGGGGALHDYSGTGGAINEFINYETLNGGAGGSCVDCHASYASNFASGHKNESHAELSTSANCTTTCHSGNLISSVHGSSCTLCHTNTSTDGRLRSGTNGDASTHTLGGPSTCADCHSDYNTNFQTGHDAEDHTGIAVSANCTTTCHTANTAATIIGTTHGNTCTLCHTNTTSNGTLIAAANGDASAGAGNCAHCHAAYNSNFANHDVQNHAGVTANGTPAGYRDNCTSCHIGDLITAVASGSDPGTHQNDCANCHVDSTSDGSLKDGVNNYGDASGHTMGGSSDCDGCHSGDGYFDAHTHSHTISEQGTDISQENGISCSSCHDDNGGSLASWTDILVEHLNDCATCHEASRDTSKSGTYSVGDTIQDIIAANGNPTACGDCHRDKIDTISADAMHGVDHLGDSTVIGASQCTGCHDQAGANSNLYFLNTIHSTCGTCHVSANGAGPLHDYSGSGGAINDFVNYETLNGGVGGSCADCHAAYATDFANRHQSEDHSELSATANCATTCHDGSLISSTHGNTCTNCHTNTATDGRLKVGALANGDATVHTVGGFSDCADCHGSYSTDFTVHDVADHSGVIANQAPANNREDCTACHSGDLISAAVSGTDPGTHQNDCTNCHTNTSNNGTLRDGANNFGDASGHAITTPSECNDCHGADGFFDTHFHAHTVSQAAGDVSQELNLVCSTCHDDNGGSLASWTDILVEHGNDCATCHDSNRDTSTSGAYTIGETITDMIAANGNPTNCIACHRDKIDTIAADATHGIDHKAQARVMGAAQCTGCHDQAGNNDNNHLLNTIHGSCGACHQAARGGGPLHDYSGTGGSIGDFVNYEAVNGGAGGLCSDCHAGYASNFVSGHKNETHAELTTSANCITTCHSGDLLSAVHGSTCTDCHVNTTTDGRLRSGADGNGDASTHTLGGSSACADCHGGYASDFSSHDVQDHTGVTTTADCATTCHTANTPATIVSVTHTNTCTNCHTNISTDGSLKSAANGDASGGAGSCASCHGAYDSNFQTAHDVGDHSNVATSANCTTTCHSGAITTIIHAACTLCHTDLTSNGTLKSATNGDGAGHINGSNSTCASCHSAYNTNFQTAHDVIDHTGITTSANCITTCHTANTPATIVSVTHTDTCTNCHTNTTSDGSLKSAANGDASSGAGACADCHGDYNTNFQTAHDLADHSGMLPNQAPANNREDCANCHTGHLITAVASGSNPGTHQNDCANCHTNTSSDGSLIDGANNYGDATGHSLAASSECDDCHLADGYFDSHTHSHTVSQGAGDLSQESGAACATCHDDNGGSLTSWADIFVEHLSACSTCHDASRDTSKSGTYTIGQTVADIIGANSDPTNCAACHRDKIDSISANAGHGIDHKADARVTGSDQCTGCHDQAANDSNDHYLITIHTTCGACHVRVGGGGALHDYSGTGGSIGDFVNYETINSGAGGACADCHAAYGASFENGHKNESHGEMATSANCTTSCHIGDIVNTIHAGTCGNCHTNTSTDGRLRSGAGGNGDASSHTIGVSSACADCHTAYDSNFQTAHDVGDHSNVATSANCTATCHSGAITTVLHGGCTTCHTNMAANGTLKSATNGDGAGHINGSDSTCADCHTAYNSNFQTAHDVGDHTGITTSANCATTCHTANTAATIVSTTHGDICTLCHTTIDSNGSLKSATNGDASGGSGTCASCHSAYNTDFQTAHDVADHSGVIANQAPANNRKDCVNCHTGNLITAVVSGSDPGTHQNSCTKCHTHATNDGTLTDGANNYGDASAHSIAVASDCDACHSADGYFDSHTHVHTVSLDASDLSQNVSKSCGAVGGCHNDGGDNLGSWASILLEHDAYDGTQDGIGACTVCHDASRDTSASGTYSIGETVQDVIAANAATICTSCHRDKIDAIAGSDALHRDHVVNGSTTTAAQCSSCHTGTTNAEIINVMHGASGCATCHVSAAGGGPLHDYSGTGGAINDLVNYEGINGGAGGACTGCHVRYASNFETGHQNESHVELTTIAKCSSCHSGAINTVMHDSCIDCHTEMASDGTLKLGDNGYGTAAGHSLGSSSSCADCHAAYDTSFGTGHQNEDHGLVTATSSGTPTLNCGGCHTGNLITGSDNHNSNCNACHTDSDANGSFTSGALGSATGHTLGVASECSDCHAANYFASHTHVHTVSLGAGDLSQEAGTSCSGCHDDNSGSLASWTDIFVEHLSDCTTCHNASRDVCADGAKCTQAGTTIQDVITANTDPTNCAACHEAKIDSISSNAAHGIIDHVAEAKVTGVSQCTGCHDQAGNNNNDQYLTTIHGTCGKCHVSSSGAGPLHDYSGSGGTINDFINYEAINLGAGGSCVTCHVRYNTNFQSGHQNESHAELTTSSNCTATCHSGAIATVVHGSCTTCHTDTVANGILRAGTNGTASTHTLGGSSTCADCHGAYNTNFQTAHDVKDHTGIAISANCTTTCHTANTAATIVSVTHGNTCTNCHTNTTSNGSLKSAANGDASGGAGTCASCHSAYNSNFLTAHDVGDHSGITFSANCATTCHTANTAATIVSVTHGNTCTTCHTNTVGDGTLKSATNGDGSGHVNGSNSDCAACHSAYSTNFGTAHDVSDHSGMIANQAPANNREDCANCHTGNLITAVASGSNPGTHQNDCANCHVNTLGDGTLIDGVNNYGDATGHAITVPSECDDCHQGDGYFDSHTHSHTVSQGAGDRSQELNQACSGCHDDNGGALTSWTDIFVEHLSACSTCHDTSRDTSKSGTYSIGETVWDIISDNGDPTNCAACHRDKIDTIAADATHGIDHKGAGRVVGSAQCTSCHDQAGNDNNVTYLNTIHTTCGTCHVSVAGGGPLRDYSGSGGAINDFVNYEALNSGAGGSCTVCHVRYATNFETGHQNEDHRNGADSADMLTTSSNCTTTCHTANSAATIVSATHGTTGCTACHTDMATDGSLKNATNGNASGHSIDSASTCTDCHSAYDSNFAAAHDDPDDHSALAGFAECTGCHNGDLIAGANVHNSTCSFCHTDTTANGTLKNGTNGDASGHVLGVTSTCADCHGAYDSNFASAHDDPDDHSGLTGFVECIGCHDDSMISGANLHNSTCTLCHTDTTSNGSLKSATNGDASGHTVGSTSTCATCHPAYDTGFATAHDDPDDHSGLSGSAECTGCHNGDLISGANVHNNSCSVCHNSTTSNGSLKSGTNGDSSGHSVGSTSTCVSCHSAYDSNFAAAHDDPDDHSGIGGSAKCTGCHAGDFITAATTHNSSCTTCHTNTTSNGSLKNATNGNASGHRVGTTSTCADCHGAYDSNFNTAHDVGDHSGVIANPSPANVRENCVSCHTGDRISSTASGSDPGTHQNDCTNCHTNTGSDGSLKDGASNYGDASGHTVAAASDCDDCHSGDGYFDGHTHSHTVSKAAGDVSFETATDCADCHDASGGSLSSWNDILIEHDLSGAKDGIGACTTCHDASRDVCSDADKCTQAGTTIQDIIAANTDPTNCVACHPAEVDSTSSNAEHHRGYVTYPGTLPGCQSCHVSVLVTGVHTGCSQCHTTPPTLKNINDVSDPDYTWQIPAGGGTCNTCHNDHDILEEAGVDETQTPSQLCGTCHGGTDNAFTDFSEIKMHHKNDCATCHKSANPTVIDVVTNTARDTQVNCTDCHTAVTDHLGHPNVEAGIEGSFYSDAHVGQQTLQCFTSGCHASNTVEEHMNAKGVAYKNFTLKYGQKFKCELCHQYKYAVSTLKDNNGYGCSDPSFTDQSSCEAGTPTWWPSVNGCSDSRFSDQSSCEAGTPQWAILTINDDPVIQSAIISGIQGNTVYCTDCHSNNTGRYDAGSCSNPSYHSQTQCEANSATWTARGYCDKVQYDNQADCQADSGTWTLEIPYSIYDKYQPGTYHISDLHHAAEEYAGTCSDNGITDEFTCYATGTCSDSRFYTEAECTAPGWCSRRFYTDQTSCEDNGGIWTSKSAGSWTPKSSSDWTPSYTADVTYTRNGKCDACHIDPRTQPRGGVSALPQPKILACSVCHADQSGTGGDYNTGQFTIYKERDLFQIAPYGGDVTWNTSFTGNIANTDPAGQTGLVHQWNVDGGQIQNYGACVFCHKMRPYHAYPGLTKDDPNPNAIDLDDSDGTVDPMHFAGPGRDFFSTFFGINRRQFKYYKDINFGTQTDNKNEHNDMRDEDKLPDNSITYAYVTYDPLADPVSHVPTSAVCADPDYLNQTDCENSGNWWRPGHVIETPEYFVVPTLDAAAGGDSVAVENGTDYDDLAKTVYVVGSQLEGSVGTMYAVYGNKIKAMAFVENKQSRDHWDATFTAADGVQALPYDTMAGRVYVISVDETSETKDVLSQDYLDF